MTLMLTATGRTVDLATLASDEVDVEHICHCLPRINRFGGLTHYNVAAHSLHVAAILADEGATPLMQLCGLLHDAHEAYLGDITQPVKQLFTSPGDGQGSMLSGIELRLQKTVLQRFCLWAAFTGFYKRVHRADMIALATERRDLLPPTDVEWPCLRGITPHHWNLANGRLQWTVKQWEDTFASKLAELQTAVAIAIEQQLGGRRRVETMPSTGAVQ